MWTHGVVGSDNNHCSLRMNCHECANCFAMDEAQLNNNSQAKTILAPFCMEHTV